VRALHDDPQPLIDVCNGLPQTLLHNDVKTGNIAIEGATVWLFDWALAGFGPVGSELGWLLGVNSSRLPWSLDQTLDVYGAHLRRALGALFDEEMWKRQQAVAHVSGLLEFGWAKGDDPEELGWWCERALAATDAFGW
jgi:aminoglycoside phosphotransferase (APT) family kinase protein